MPPNSSMNTCPRPSKSAPEGFNSIQRQAFLFAGICLSISLMIVAIFEPRTLNTPAATARALINRVAHNGASFNADTVATLLGMSFGAGLIGGMLGMGGGVLKVAGLLILFKLDIYFARAVSVAAMFFMSLSALPAYVRKGQLLWRMVLPTLVPSIFGVLLGILLGNHLGGAVLSHLFGFFVIFLSFTTMGQTFLDPHEKSLENAFEKDMPLTGRRKGALYFIGSMHGFLCGLFGISGGIHTIPAQQVFLDIPIRHAIANTLAISTVCAGVGSILVAFIGVERGDYTARQILLAYMCVAIGAFLGAQTGTRLADRMNTHILRTLVEIIGLVAGFSIVL